MEQKTLKTQKKILVLCEKVGIKRAGIKVAKEGKYIVEILGTHNITAPIKEGKFVIDKKHTEYLVKKANQKFIKNQKTLEKLTKQIKKEIK